MYYTAGHHIIEDIFILEWRLYRCHLPRTAAVYINTKRLYLLIFSGNDRLVNL